MMEKSKRKLQGFHKRPSNITATKKTAVVALVLNTDRFNAITAYQKGLSFTGTLSSAYTVS